jgi:zinc-binding alcohol dehydrogenase/oxidoreductase
MRAIQLSGQGLAGFRLTEVQRPAPGPGQVLVRLKAAALNHRDLWACRGWRDGKRPVIMGSDGAGVVEALGAGVDGLAPGTAVIINPSLDWDSGPAPDHDYHCLGDPTDGTLAEFVAVPRGNVHPRPAHLDWHQAAALPLSFLTAWRALFPVGGLQAGERLVITGIGGGTALAGLTLAQAAGAKVAVTSRDALKREKALAAGADLAFESSDSWAAELRAASGGKGADLVLETVGQPTWAQSFAALERGGRLVTYGSTGGDQVTLELVPLFLGWRSVLGTTMGSAEDFAAMLAFVTRHRLAPVIDRVFPLAEGVEALTHLDWAGQFGKVVVAMEG